MVYDPRTIPQEALQALCRRYGVTELSLFGSALGGEFRPDSDLDLLVSFAPDARVGFLAFSRLTRELSVLLGRRIDLVPKAGLKSAIQAEVLSRTEVLFAE
jgi:predicted nucleotidyltransferase